MLDVRAVRWWLRAIRDDNGRFVIPRPQNDARDVELGSRMTVEVFAYGRTAECSFSISAGTL